MPKPEKPDLFFSSIRGKVRKEAKGEISMRMKKTPATFIVLSFLIATAFLAFITGTSTAQKAQLVPLFSITGADIVPKLNRPSDVFIDEKHSEIYVVDQGNKRVVVFDINGRYQYQFATPAKLGRPSGLVINNRDEILLAIGGKVACYDFRGRLLEYVKFHGLPSSEKVYATRLKIDRNNSYYILDTKKRRVLVFDTDGNFKFAITNESLPKVKRMVKGKEQEEPMVKSLSISDICLDDEGMIYLVDYLAARVFVFSSNGEYLRSIGKPGSVFDTLSFPNGVAVDIQGRLLVVDTMGHGILGYDKKGKLLFALGGFGKSEGWFYYPRYISTDRNGRIYVVEPFLGRIQVLSIKTLS